MRWDRERYIANALFEDTGREMFCELFGAMHRLKEEWRLQGASEKEIDMTAFDWDYVPLTILAGNMLSETGIVPQVLYEDHEVKLEIDHMGRHTRLIKNSATIPLPEDHPMNVYEDWEKVKHWYRYSDTRIDRDKLLQQKKERDNGSVSLLILPGAFDEPRELMGEEMLCLMCYEAPEILQDMMETFTETSIRVIEECGSFIPLDNLFIHEDMAGRSGPLFGPAQIREFFRPYYTRVWEAAKAYGARLFSPDSDGDISPILDELVDCGINSIHPIEPAGGMDLLALRRKYGSKLNLKGGIDKFALLHGKEAIRAELERRITPETMHGGTIFALDHLIPNGVPLEDYRYYVNLGREMLGLPPVQGEGWARMAF